MKELINQHFIKNFAWGKLYRTDIVKRHLFPIGKYYEDSYWQHLVINDCERIGVLSEPLYYYRQRSDSISGSFSERYIDLLKGNECRYAFIQHYYPQLENLFASHFWKLCYAALRRAESTGDESLIAQYSYYFNYVTERYGELFDSALSGSLEYLFRDSFLSRLYLLFVRLKNHYFSKRPRRIDL